MSDTYIDIPEYIGNSINYLISSIVSSGGGFCILVWKIHNNNPILIKNLVVC